MIHADLKLFEDALADLGPKQPLDACFARLQHYSCFLTVLAGRPSRYGPNCKALRAAQNAGRAATYALRAAANGHDPNDPWLWREIHALLMSGLLPPNRCGVFRDGNMLLLDPRGRPLASALPPTLLGAALEAALAELRRLRGTHALDAAGLSKLALARLHPFADGTGRTARIVLEAGLVSAGIPALPMTLVFERCRVEYLQAIGAAARSADPEPWLSFLHRAAMDAVLALNEVRPRLADLRDELVEALGQSLSESDAKRLAVAILEEPVAHEPALQRRTRLAPKKIAAGLDRLAGHAFVRRMALGQGDHAWLMAEGIDLLRPSTG